MQYFFWGAIFSGIVAGIGSGNVNLTIVAFLFAIAIQLRAINGNLYDFAHLIVEMYQRTLGEKGK